ncbi:MAG: MFS transporter [Burkholderiales bacterium]|nr:MFS transporter [Burkholderiales bacterium]
MFSMNRRIIIFVIVCTFSFMHAFMQSLPITTSFYFEKLFNINSNEVLNLYSLYLIACILMQIPIGILFARYGIRIVIIVSLCIAIFGSLLHQFSYSPLILASSRLIIGFAFATSYLSAVYVAMNFFSPRYLVLLIGIVEAATTFGSIVAAAPFYSILNTYGWHNANFLIIFVLVTILCLTYFFIQNPNHNQIESGENKEIEYKFFAELINIFSNKAVILLIIYAFLNWFIMMSFAGYWIRDYMINIHEYSAQTALILSNIYWGAFLVGNLLIGLFTKTFKKLKIAAFTLSIMTVVTFLIMVIPYVFSYSAIVIFCVFAGVSGVCVILAFAFIPYLMKKDGQKGMISSIVNMAIVTGGVVGQYIFGFMIYHIQPQKIYFNNPLFSNSYYLSLWLYVAASIGALLVFYKFTRSIAKV